MKVETERTTVGGDAVDETYEGICFTNPPHSRPRVDETEVLGSVTGIKELDGGTVVFDPADDADLIEYSPVLDVTVGPEGEQARLTFIASEAEMVPLGSVLYAKSNAG